MTTLSLATPRPPADLSGTLRRWFARAPLTMSFAVLAVAALILRSAWFGLPFAGYDEGLYLLIGDRMLHGAVPYVDIWDRKPPGLFVLYAGIRLLGGDGVLQYQLAATASVVATALVVVVIVRRRYRDTTALLCGLAYVLYCGVMGGEAGQAPLFYNLPMAIAAWLVLRALPRLDTRRGVAQGALAMLACGIALTIKTTAIFESLSFGVILLAGAMHARVARARFAGMAALFALAGAVPFATAGLVYWSIGHFDAFWFANAESAMLRAGALHAQQGYAQIAATAMAMAPLLFMALAGAVGTNSAPRRPRGEAWVLAAWIAAAAIAYASVGYYFHHYALPLLVPLAIASARFIEGGRHRRLALILFALYPAVQQVVLSRILLAGDRADITAIVDAIPAGVERECMFLFGAPPMLTHLTRACTVTRYAFSDHLFAADEAPAIGTDAVQATRDALARRPLVIVTDPRSFPPNPNRAAWAAVQAALARDYRLHAVRHYRSFEDTRHFLSIWVRRDAVLPARIG